MTVEELDSDEFDGFGDLTENEIRAEEANEHEFDDISMENVNNISDTLVNLIPEFTGVKLFPYQSSFARRIIECLVLGERSKLTATWPRQCGKSETVANVIAICMVMLPSLAALYPGLLGKFKNGLLVGCFAPTDDQAQIVYSRVVSRLTSKPAKEFIAGLGLGLGIDKVPGEPNTIGVTNGSIVRRQTAHPRSNIEGKTYHLVLIDESQAVEQIVITKSISPMLAFNAGLMVLIGTPGFVKGAYYNQIQLNKVEETKRGRRRLHYGYTWKDVAKYNKEYAAYIRDEMLSLGEDSIEFRMSYLAEWQLGRGMFVTSSKMEQLGNKGLKLVHAWHKTPVVVGIDVASKQDSTVVTVMAVDWDNVDEMGEHECTILNWLELEGVEWEDQYFRIAEFLENYNVFAVGVDSGGLGGPVIDRIQRMLPRVKVYPIPSDRASQSERWKQFNSLISREKISWPAHAEVRRLKIFKRFLTQMENLELKFDGPYFLTQAPKISGAHDDFPDSIAIAIAVMKKVSASDDSNSQVIVTDNFFYR